MVGDRFGADERLQDGGFRKSLALMNGYDAGGEEYMKVYLSRRHRDHRGLFCFTSVSLRTL